MLAGVVLFHGAEGGAIIARWFTGRAPSKRVRRSIAALTATAVFFGLYRISQEPLQIRGLQLERIKTVYNMGPIYRLLS